jgi:sulfur carrier protein
MTVNGKQINLKELDVNTLLDLIKHYSLQPEAIAVERNGEVPPKEKWGEIIINDNDRIELIRFVGGG